MFTYPHLTDQVRNTSVDLPNTPFLKNLTPALWALTVSIQYSSTYAEFTKMVFTLPSSLYSSLLGGGGGGWGFFAGTNVCFKQKSGTNME
jgi:hypothetical protein